MLNTPDYRDALSDKGPKAYDWFDKPHRLVYDLCKEVDRLNEQIAILQKSLRDCENRND